jgi:hypothetical protein
MWSIRRHYDSVQRALAVDQPDTEVIPGPRPHVVVPVASLDRAALHALAFAQSISDDVVAVHVAEDRLEAERARARWEQLGGDVRLVIVESPYRSLLPPLLAYIDAVDESDPDPSDYRRALRVRPAALVGVVPAQSDGAAPEAPPLLPP